MNISLKPLLLLLFASTATLLAQSPRPLFNALDTLRKAEGYYELQKYDTAARCYGKIPAGDTLYPLALLEKSRSHYLKKDYQASIQTAQKGLELGKGYYAGFLNLMASAYGDNNEAQKAYEIYRRAIAKYPSDYQLYYSRGATYQENEQYQKALADYQKAIELNPFHYYSHVRLAALALNEERFAEALMSLGYAYLAADNVEQRLSLTVSYDRALSGELELETKGLEIEPERSFKRVNLLLKSRAALREDYEIDLDLTFPLVRQMHLTYTQVAQAKPNPNDFWSQFYQPFYQALIDEGLFEELTLLMVRGSEQEYHQKLLRKNEKDVEEFYSWAGQNIIRNNAIHQRGYKPQGQWVRFFYHEGSEKLSGIAELNQDKEVEGKYIGYYLNGSKQSEGEYNAQTNRTGAWVFYHESGDTSRLLSYANGRPQGPLTEWHDNGHLSLQSEYNTQGDLYGLTKIYNRHGLLTRELTLEAGVIEDTSYYYFAGGGLSSQIPMEAGKAQGKATFYHENGDLASEIPYARDERSGKAVFYHPGGQVKSRASYQEGELHGQYTSYHPNGQLASKGKYLEGVKSGLWKMYDATGNLTQEETFDDKGKQTGRSTEYDPLGRKTATFIYKKGEIKSYQLFDLKGNIRKEGDQKGGDFYLKYYNLYGDITSEGKYAGDHKMGLWKYYNDYGVLVSEEMYNEQGELQGPDKGYYLSGALKSINHYEKGELHGHYVEYYQNEAKKEEGWFTNGEQSGPFYEYFANGALYTKAYYVKGKLNGPRYNYDVEGNYTFVEFFDKGVLTRIDDYRDGERYKTNSMASKGAMQRYYPNGQILLKTEKYGPTFHGLTTRYYGHGQKSLQGQYANGYRHGKWSYYYPNGELNYSGKYELGTPVGEWQYYHPNGKRKEKRIFLNGQLHGENPGFDDEGNLETLDNYLLGERHGKRYFYLPKGVLNHVRIYDQDRIIGYVKETGEGADTAVIPIKNGTAEVKSYYANGQLARTYNLNKGMFKGEYRVYYPDGTLALEGDYIDDEREGEYVYYYPNGKVQEKRLYEKGLRNGLTTKYYANGRKKVETPYMYGKKNGEAIYYNENGEETHRYLYINDKIYEKL